MLPILITGVSGSGKSTIGKAVASRTGGTFLDADDFHPQANIDKLSNGIPLTDADRIPWLEILVKEIKCSEHRPPVILACSALKKRYRQFFRDACPGIRIIFLDGEFDLIRKRMEERQGHFMKAGMLESQFADLEKPTDAIRVDIDQPEEAIIKDVMEVTGEG